MPLSQIKRVDSVADRPLGGYTARCTPDMASAQLQTIRITLRSRGLQMRRLVDFKVKAKSSPQPSPSVTFPSDICIYHRHANNLVRLASYSNLLH